MAVILTDGNDFKISGVFLYNLVQLAESVKQNDLNSIFLLCGQIAQHMENYDFDKNILKD